MARVSSLIPSAALALALLAGCSELPRVETVMPDGLLGRALNDANAKQGAGPSEAALESDWRGREPVVLKLSIAACLDLARGNNRELLIERLNVEIAEAGVVSASAFTDMVLGSNANLDRNERSIQSRFVGDTRTREEQTEYGGDISLRAPFYTGTTATVQHSLNRITTNSPFNSFEWNSTLGLTLRQNLLEGFGAAVNRTDLDVAKGSLAATVLDANATRNDVSYAVHEAYWNLVLAGEDLAVLKRQRESAVQALERARRRAAEGLDRGLEELRARSTLTDRDRDIISANLEVARRSDALLRAIHPDLLAGYGLVRGYRLVVEPDALAETEAVPVPDVLEQVTLAFSQRSDLAAAVKRLENQGLRVRQRTNRLLPTLEATLGATLRGSGDDYGATVQGIQETDSRTFTVGLSFEMALENSADRAAMDTAKAELARDTARLRDLELDILSNVVDAIRELQAGNQSVSAAREARDLAVQEEEATRVRLELQVGTSFEVKQAEADRTARERDLIRARVERELARLKLLRATGALTE